MFDFEAELFFALCLGSKSYSITSYLFSHSHVHTIISTDMISQCFGLILLSVLVAVLQKQFLSGKNAETDFTAYCFTVVRDWLVCFRTWNRRIRTGLGLGEGVRIVGTFLPVWSTLAMVLLGNCSGHRPYDLSRQNQTISNIPGVNFTNVLRASFMLIDPKSVKNKVKSSVSFYAFRICARKSWT